jgi:uncharacterized membrane protein HdeD (DUF308 family)
MTTTVASKSAAAAPAHQGRPWWVTLILGIAAVFVGALLVFGTTATKVDTYLTLVGILGLWWLISGIMDIVSIFMDHTMWGWKLFIGIVSIIAGGWILANRLVAAIWLPQVFVLIIGIYALMYGIIMLFMAFKGGGWAAGILGAIELVLGFILIGNYAAPGAGLAFLWGAAICALIGGVFLIIMAFMQRRA